MSQCLKPNSPQKPSDYLSVELISVPRKGFSHLFLTYLLINIGFLPFASSVSCRRQGPLSLSPLSSALHLRVTHVSKWSLSSWWVIDCDSFLSSLGGPQQNPPPQQRPQPQGQPPAQAPQSPASSAASDGGSAKASQGAAQTRPPGQGAPQGQRPSSGQGLPQNQRQQSVSQQQQKGPSHKAAGQQQDRPAQPSRQQSQSGSQQQRARPTTQQPQPAAQGQGGPGGRPPLQQKPKPPQKPSQDNPAVGSTPQLKWVIRARWDSGVEQPWAGVPPLRSHWDTHVMINAWLKLSFSTLQQQLHKTAHFRSPWTWWCFVPSACGTIAAYDMISSFPKSFVTHGFHW